MRIFISYRRDDTAGRAGRLFDVLVSRLGERNVFQDVTAIAPGTDFTQQVDDAIARSDVVLVVIGSEWLVVRGADGTRRLDEPGDYVRAEVAAALGTDVPVVPVLVGAADMPSPADLPDELRPLANRQAARIRDESWHQDVDALVRRLEGEAVVTSSHRRWPLLVAPLIVIVAVAVFGWLWIDGDGDGDDDDGATVDAEDVTTDGTDAVGDPPPCTRPDDSWEPIELAADPTAEGTDPLGRAFLITIEEANHRAQSDETAIVVGLRIDNTSAGTSEEFGYFVAPTDIEGLFAGGVTMGPLTCYSASPRQLNPGSSSAVLLGFEGQYEPGSSLVLATKLATLDVTVTDGD